MKEISSKIKAVDSVKLQRAEVADAEQMIRSVLKLLWEPKYLQL